MNFIDYTILFFFTNNIIIIIIFWFLTYIGSFFLKKNEFSDKNEFYECGFKTFSDFNFKINSGILITMVFVIFYDLEFIFTIPYLLNHDLVNSDNYLLIVIMYLSILLTFLIDIYEDIIS